MRVSSFLSFASHSSHLLHSVAKASSRNHMIWKGDEMNTAQMDTSRGSYLAHAAGLLEWAAQGGQEARTLGQKYMTKILGFQQKGYIPEGEEAFAIAQACCELNVPWFSRESGYVSREFPDISNRIVGGHLFTEYLRCCIARGAEIGLSDAAMLAAEYFFRIAREPVKSFGTSQLRPPDVQKTLNLWTGACCLLGRDASLSLQIGQGLWKQVQVNKEGFLFS